jgi:predicted HicB family RNase H-like nuclease
MKKPAPAPEPELRNAPLHALIRPSVKALAVEMAKEDERSLAQWLERTIRAEAERRGKKV